MNENCSWSQKAQNSNSKTRIEYTITFQTTLENWLNMPKLTTFNWIFYQLETTYQWKGKGTAVRIKWGIPGTQMCFVPVTDNCLSLTGSLLWLIRWLSSLTWNAKHNVIHLINSCLCCHNGTDSKPTCDECNSYQKQEAKGEPCLVQCIW